MMFDKIDKKENEFIKDNNIYKKSAIEKVKERVEKIYIQIKNKKEPIIFEEDNKENIRKANASISEVGNEIFFIVYGTQIVRRSDAFNSIYFLSSRLDLENAVNEVLDYLEKKLILYDF